jgi:hypothetical protein
MNTLKSSKVLIIKDNATMGELKNEHYKKKSGRLNTAGLPRSLWSLAMTTLFRHCEGEAGTRKKGYPPPPPGGLEMVDGKNEQN